MNVEQRQDQSHAYIDTVLYLAKICRPGIIVDFDRDLIDPGKRMKNIHCLLYTSRKSG